MLQLPMNNDVISAILSRVQEGSRPRQRRDAHKIGLAIEGGSMRGVVTAGMVAGLEYLGLLPTFDVVYGTSAGAMNGAFFVAGQAAYGTTIYYENINNKCFIDLTRILLGKPIVSLEYILDDVFVRQKVLAWERVLSSPIPLVAVASSISRSCSVALRDFDGRDELFQAMRASARMPAITGPPVSFRGDRYLDGSVYESIPNLTAASDGCTHILTLQSRPLHCRIGRGQFIEQRIVAPWIRSFSRGMALDVCLQKDRYRQQLVELARKSELNEPSPFVYSICPASVSGEIGKMEKSRALLLSGAVSGMLAVIGAFGGEVITALEVLQPYTKAGLPLLRP